MRIWLALVLVTALVTGLFAQTDLSVDIDRWTALAERVEAAVDDENTSDEVLEEMRTQIVEFRSEFDAASDLNAKRIATLREQLAALGTTLDGETAAPEAPNVVAARTELNEQLSILLVPVQRAEAEFVRADAIVTQIDQTLRERGTKELLASSPSPMNPLHWETALSDLKAALYTLWQETPDANDGLEELRKTLPVTVLLTALGAVLIFRGRFWSRMIVNSLQRFGARGFGIWRFLVSLLRIVLPFGGLFLLALAVISAGYFGPSVDEIVFLLAFLSGVMLGMRWVAERVFSRDDDEALILLPPERRKRLRFHVGCITALVVVGELIAQVLASGNPAPASRAVLMFPIMVLAAISLYWIGIILRGYVDPSKDENAVAEIRSSTLVRVLHFIGTGAIVVAVVAPLLAAAGYHRAAEAIFPPYIMTMALLGLVMSLQRFTADVYGAISGQGDQAREALLPVLFGLILLILAAPLFALIWGARVTDLTELWGLFLRGFAIGDSRISPTDFIAFAAIFAFGYVLTRLVQSALRGNVLPKTQMDVGAQNAIVSGLGYVGIFLAALAAITGAGIDLSSLAIVAGALSVGIGFGLQTVVSNFVSGIILLIERPISEGDWIEVGGQMGYVRDISVRSTRIETFDKTDVIVPNADLVSGTVTNYTRGNTVGRVIVRVGVAYGSDTKKVETILREIAEAQPMVLATPPPNVLFVNFGADSLDFEVRCFLRDVNWMMAVKSDMNHAIAARFTAEGIEIPFAQRDIWLRNPEALRSDQNNGDGSPGLEGPSAQGAGS
ncbi:DUF3772 domain-containing protein [Sulfitobacter sp. F26204]|uniref:DUF3772 domain-containing protein n=1 Tax=Sulfitobacter sp. F26204 TaxID=2996014 RepID=UPI00225E1200|nr:DUF3772 domain-containing protein [Sulfitobacter sp. F26204]MCX7559654.1 DUF3772 domain-containing protein [Sulfitobacter sp. F26204]